MLVYSKILSAAKFLIKYEIKLHVNPWDMFLHREDPKTGNNSHGDEYFIVFRVLVTQKSWAVYVSIKFSERQKFSCQSDEQIFDKV